MRSWNIDYEFAGIAIPLAVNAPPASVDPIESYRSVTFELPGKGLHRAVFFLLPDRNSDDPVRAMPPNAWQEPVRWDDNTMLFVPTLDDQSIVAAMNYVLENGLENSAFENASDIARDPGDER